MPGLPGLQKRVETIREHQIASKSIREGGLVRWEELFILKTSCRLARQFFYIALASHRGGSRWRVYVPSLSFSESQRV